MGTHLTWILARPCCCTEAAVAGCKGRWHARGQFGSLSDLQSLADCTHCSAPRSGPDCQQHRCPICVGRLLGIPTLSAASNTLPQTGVELECLAAEIIPESDSGRFVRGYRLRQ